jgi:hypothetical protein
MSKTRRLIHIAAMPVVASAIYVWLIREAYRDAKHMLKLRWGTK